MAAYICPTCQKEVRAARREEIPHRPFCCERCKLLDLAKWFNEEYRIEIPLRPDGQNDPDHSPPPSPV